MNSRQAACAGVALLGAAVLASWTLKWEIGTRIHPDWVTMKPFTAASFLIAGVAVWSTHTAHKWLGFALGYVTLVASVLLFAVGLAETQLLLEPESMAKHSWRPGVPCWFTLTGFLTVSVAVMGRAMSDGGDLMRVSRGVCLGTGGIVVAGYVLGIPWLRFEGLPGFTSMAMHTAIGFVALGMGHPRAEVAT